MKAPLHWCNYLESEALHLSWSVLSLFTLFATVQEEECCLAPAPLGWLTVTKLQNMKTRTVEGRGRFRHSQLCGFADFAAFSFLLFLFVQWACELKSQAIELYCCIARGRGVEVIQASKWIFLYDNEHNEHGHLGNLFSEPPKFNLLTDHLTFCSAWSSAHDVRIFQRRTSLCCPAAMSVASLQGYTIYFWFVLIPYCKTLRCFKSSAISIWVYHSWKLPFNGISIALLAPFLTNREASNTLSPMQAASPSEARVSLARISAFPSNIPMWKLMRLIILILVVTAADPICEEVTLLRWRRRDLLLVGEVRHLLGG